MKTEDTHRRPTLVDKPGEEEESGSRYSSLLATILIIFVVVSSIRVQVANSFVKWHCKENIPNQGVKTETSQNPNDRDGMRIDNGERRNKCVVQPWHFQSK